MKLEETENLKLQYVNRIETNTTNINNIQESIQTSLKKSPKYLIFMKNTQTLKANHLSKNGVIIADDMDIAFLNVDKNSKIIKTNLKNIKNRINHSINT